MSKLETHEELAMDFQLSLVEFNQKFPSIEPEMNETMVEDALKQIAYWFFMSGAEKSAIIINKRI